MENVIAAVVLFGLCMGAMSLGILLSGKKLQGSCGGASKELSANGEESDGCGFCVKKANDVCKSSEENGELIRIATLGSPPRP